MSETATNNSVQGEETEKVNLVKISARINQKIDDVMREMAKEYGVSFSEVVRLAIDGHLEQYFGNVQYMDAEQGREIRMRCALLGTEMQHIRNELNKIGVNVNQIVIDLLERALEADENGKYRKESQIHSIICPMQTTSDEIKFDDMNLWLIDDRLAYHHFLASDKKINTIPVLENNVDKRMDLAIFDAALSYTSDPENINSITIVELKRPQRNDLATEETDPITQVYDYVSDIKDGKVKKANGRGFVNIQQVAFYCYVIADITPTLKKSAARAGLVLTQDGGGYFGYNQTIGTYIEVISYDKLLKDAKQRNRALFDKLFEPKSKDLIHPERI